MINKKFDFPRNNFKNYTNENKNVSDFFKRKHNVIKTNFFWQQWNKKKCGSFKTCQQHIVLPAALEVNLEVDLELRPDVIINDFCLSKTTLTSFCKEWKINLQNEKYYRKVKIICKNCLNKEINCDFWLKAFTKKWMPTLIKRSYNTRPASNNRTLIVMPSSSVKTHLFMRKLKNNIHRNTFSWTRCPEH